MRDWFKLNIGSYFRLLCSLSFMTIFLLSLFFLLSCSVVMPPNLLLLFGVLQLVSEPRFLASRQILICSNLTHSKT
jgi:hypothetical protein